MHVKDLLSLKGKVILITGGKGLYGNCMLESLAEADKLNDGIYRSNGAFDCHCIRIWQR